VHGVRSAAGFLALILVNFAAIHAEISKSFAA